MNPNGTTLRPWKWAYLCHGADREVGTGVQMVGGGQVMGNGGKTEFTAGQEGVDQKRQVS